MSKELYGKNAIITGSNRGIGRAIVEKFAENGCNIWACARKPSAEFEDDIGSIAKKYGVWIKPVYFDMSSEEDVKNGIKSILKEKKTVDILVNNAGVPHGGLMTMTSISTLKEVFEINFFSQIQIMQYTARQMMRQKNGCIINMCSVGGIETQPGFLAYGSSKAALIWTTKSVSKELGPYNIRVNGIAAGLIDTDMGNYKSEKELEKSFERMSIKRFGTSNEIAEATLYMASEKASFMTGHIMVIDGGGV